MSTRGLAARIRAEIEILDSELDRAGAALDRLAQSEAIRELCEQAQRSTATRDPILPEEIRPTLNDARSFRHRVRTAYGVEFDPDLLKGVYRRIAEAAPIIKHALFACADDLDRLAE